MEVPTQTKDIFETLSRGQFISSNSTDDNIRKLYSIIEEEQNYDTLYEYFRNINFTLEKGEEYFYFSRVEAKADLERKIEYAYKWIDILDFLKTYDNSFSSGYRFTPSDILVRLKTDADLETKLVGLNKYTGKDKYPEIIERVLQMLVNETFIGVENSISNMHKVLASFKYLEQLVLTINIPDSVRNEIPE